jgi:hypothetical protein
MLIDEHVTSARLGRRTRQRVNLIEPRRSTEHDAPAPRSTSSTVSSRHGPKCSSKRAPGNHREHETVTRRVNEAAPQESSRQAQWPTQPARPILVLTDETARRAPPPVHPVLDQLKSLHTSVIATISQRYLMSGKTTPTIHNSRRPTPVPVGRHQVTVALMMSAVPAGAGTP